MKRIFVLLLILTAFPFMAIAAEVQDLKVLQSGEKMVVATYDLVGGKDEKQAEVTIVITIDGQRLTADKVSLTGDFGKGVKIGKGKKIVWNAMKDLPSNFDGEFRLDVEVAKRENVGSYKDPFLRMEFVYVHGGCYQMGDTFGDGFPSEKPVHEVCVSDFALAKYDVTVGEFCKFTIATGYKTEAEEEGGCGVFNGTKWEWDPSKNWRNPGFNQDDSQPVVCVSWNDAEAFITWLSEVSSRRYRLPTEAEWEYAARSGGKKEEYAGGNDINAVAWYYDNDGRTTHRVGTKQPNGLGLYDMSGNVLQWVQDWYDDNYYRDSLRSNPQGPGSGFDRVLRGSAWSDKPPYVRAARRSMKPPSHRGSLLGFRLAFSPEP